MNKAELIKILRQIPNNAEIRWENNWYSYEPEITAHKYKKDGSVLVLLGCSGRARDLYNTAAKEKIDLK